MRACKYCNIEFEDEINFRIIAGHVANCKQNPLYVDRNDRISKKLTRPKFEIELVCKSHKCDKKFSIFLSQSQFEKGKFRTHCSRTCANSHVRTIKSRQKASLARGGTGILKNHAKAGNCPECNEFFDSGMKMKSHIKRSHSSWESRKTDRARKVRLIEEFGHRCKICELTEWMSKPIPIELDHIDGNPENTSKDNFRLLCPNCHAQTDTYKGKNIGKVQNTKRQKKLKENYGKYR